MTKIEFTEDEICLTKNGLYVSIERYREDINMLRDSKDLTLSPDCKKRLIQQFEHQIEQTQKLVKKLDLE